MSVAEYNAPVEYNLRHEHPTVKRARNQCGLVNNLEHKAHLAAVDLSNAKIQLARDLLAMPESGAPDEPWAAHWRRVFATE